MDAWMTIAGVLVGGLLSWWGTWTTTGRQIKAEQALRQAERRRSDALPIASRLINATDELWDAHQGVALAAFELLVERRAYDRPDRVAHLTDLDERRIAQMSARRDADRRARQAAAEIAIVSHELEIPARMLLARSDLAPERPADHPFHSDEQRDARARARDTFIVTARRVLVGDRVPESADETSGGDTTGEPPQRP